MPRDRLPIKIRSYSNAERCMIGELLALYLIDRTVVPSKLSKPAKGNPSNLVDVSPAAVTIYSFVREHDLEGLFIRSTQIEIVEMVSRFINLKLVTESGGRVIISQKGKRFIKRQASHLRSAAIRLVCGPLDRLAMSI